MMPILVTSVVNIVSVPLYFRYLGEEKYALWIFIATLTGAFGFMDLGMGVATGRFMGVALGKNDQEVARKLQELGVPGVRYFDAGSRDNMQGTKNFVIFPNEEKNVTILERQ